MPIFPYGPRQAFWGVLSLFVQDQRSVQQQEAVTGCFGICWGPSIGPRGRWELSSSLFSSSLCQRGSSLETLGPFVWSKQESHTGGETAITGVVLYTDPEIDLLSNSPPCSMLTPPFWLILTDWFSFAFCCFFSLLGERGSYLILYPNNFDSNPVAFWGKGTGSWQKMKHHPPAGSRGN